MSQKNFLLLAGALLIVPMVLLAGCFSSQTDWQTYENARYGYTIEYPADWYADTASSEDDLMQMGQPEDPILGGATTAFYNHDPFGGELEADAFNVNLTIYQLDSSVGYDQFISSQGFYYTQKEETNVNEMNAIRLIADTQQIGGNNITTDVLIKAGDKIFDFNYFWSNEISQQTKDQLNDLASKIINSLTIK